MSRLTLRLPETLHYKLVNLAKSEGVSLNQYIVYALSCQIHNSYTVNSLSEKEVQQQKTAFNDLIKDLDTLEDQEIRAILSQREKVDTDEELSLEIKNKLISKLN
jgi:predicted HicB family RNase H-like nuclease